MWEEGEHEQKSMENVVDSMKHTLRLAILLRRLGVCKTHLDTILVTKLIKLFIVVFNPIIKLKIFNVTLELILNVREKNHKFRQYFGIWM